MGLRLTLRMRIVLGFLVFGLVLSSAFAAVAFRSMADFERILINELLHAETQRLIELRRARPDAPLPDSRRMYAYVGDGNAPPSTAPATFAGLEPGNHVLDQDGEHETYVGVRDDGAQRLYFVIDLSNVAQREAFQRRLLAAIIVLGTLASGALGLLFAGRLVAPVQRLAHWVDASSPPRTGETLRMHFADDEVGALASAFDRYQRRLDAFLQREREFTADASHELRSPLSVLQAGLDVLAEDPGVSPPGRRALQRMHRRAAELTDLLDALLYLARSDREAPAHDETIPLLATWQQLVAGVQSEPATATPIHLAGDVAAMVSAPRRAVILVFAQLLRQALEQADGAALSIQVRPRRIEIGPWPATVEAAGNAGQARSDSRFGLTLVGRLCERLGWELRWPASGDDVLHLTLAGDARDAPKESRAR